MAESEMKSGRRNKIASWVLAVLLTLAFLFAGGAKLAGSEETVAVFAKIGIGQWFRILTGTLEVIGGIVVVIPHLRPSVAAPDQSAVPSGPPLPPDDMS